MFAAFALILSTVPSAPPSPNEAELLLREMDAKIVAAHHEEEPR